MIVNLLIRISSEAHLDDIFQELNKLDSINKLPTFVVKNINRIPDQQPEENNKISIINRVCKLEQREKAKIEYLKECELSLHELKAINLEKRLN